VKQRMQRCISVALPCSDESAAILAKEYPPESIFLRRNNHCVQS
jgi:hypothetical protein